MENHLSYEVIINLDTINNDMYEWLCGVVGNAIDDWDWSPEVPYDPYHGKVFFKKKYHAMEFKMRWV